MAVLLNDVWYNGVVEFGCISSRILWIKVSRVKLLIIIVYCPSEGVV